MKNEKSQKKSQAASAFFWDKIKLARRTISHEYATYETLIASSKASKDYYLLLVFSCIIALFGLYENSPATIIGAMIVAPLLGPIMGFSASVLWGDVKNIFGSIITLVKGIFIVLAMTSLLSHYIPGIAVNTEISARTHPAFFDLVIATACGLIGSYGAVNKKISGSLTGIAISVALMPPLCTVGIGIGLLKADVAVGALLLFATNLLGISLGSIIVFYMVKVHPGTIDSEELSGVQRRAIGQIVLSLLCIAALSSVLFYYSFSALRVTRTKERIDTIVRSHLKGNRLYSLDVEERKGSLSVNVIVLRADRTEAIDSNAIREEIARDTARETKCEIFFIDNR
jgi:uncharacterized hydrophobic protein (TIGR00271 family)